MNIALDKATHENFPCSYDLANLILQSRKIKDRPKIKEILDAIPNAFVVSNSEPSIEDHYTEFRGKRKEKDGKHVQLP